MDELAYTESSIRAHTTPQVFQRGLDYYQQHAVLSLKRRGDELLAEVEGSQYEPYLVRIKLDGDLVESALCNCPYDWGGWCKHVVAVLLAALREPKDVEEHPTLKALLEDLDREQLQALVKYLAGRHPALIDDAEHWFALNKSGEGGSAISVNPEPIRRRVHSLIHSLDHMRRSEAYWHVGEVVDEVRRVLDDVNAFVGRGDGKNSLALLEALTSEYLREWTWLDDSDGFPHAFFFDLGPAWTEALLAADLTPDEREHWAGQLDAWIDELSAYDLGDAFYGARNALEEDWADDEFGDDELINARLNILARKNEYDEFLRLAEETGQYRRYTLMLAQRGRYQEAAEAGQRHFTTAAEALALSLVLYQEGAANVALEVAEHGLKLDGHYEKAELAEWLRDRAERMGKPDLALQAALGVVRLLPTVHAYMKAQALAGVRWVDYKANILEQLRQKNWVAAPQQGIDIFLHEGLIDDAINAVQESLAGHEVLRQVAAAAVETRPEWVIATAREQAMRIIDEGRSQYYHYAVDWLRMVRDAYRASGREVEWKAYHADLQEKHRRKYKLMPMLERL